MCTRYVHLSPHTRTGHRLSKRPSELVLVDCRFTCTQTHAPEQGWHPEHWALPARPRLSRYKATAAPVTVCACGAATAPPPPTPQHPAVPQPRALPPGGCLLLRALHALPPAHLVLVILVVRARAPPSGPSPQVRQVRVVHQHLLCLRVRCQRLWLGERLPPPASVTFWASRTTEPRAQPHAFVCACACLLGAFRPAKTYREASAGQRSPLNL